MTLVVPTLVGRGNNKSTFLSSQLCGVHNLAEPPVESYAVFVSSLLPVYASDCEEVYVKNRWAADTGVHWLKAPTADGQPAMADCKYESQAVCRAPLILLYEDALEAQVDGADVTAEFKIGQHDLRLGNKIWSRF